LKPVLARTPSQLQLQTLAYCFSTNGREHNYSGTFSIHSSQSVLELPIPLVGPPPIESAPTIGVKIALLGAQINHVKQAAKL